MVDVGCEMWDLDYGGCVQLLARNYCAAKTPGPAGLKSFSLWKDLSHNN